MTSLIMDTSNQYLMVALYRDGQCLEMVQELGSKRQSENAIPVSYTHLDVYKRQRLN